MSILEQLWQTVSASLSRLSSRERRLVTLFGAVALIAGVYLFVVEPFVENRERTRRRIETLATDIDAMQTLANRIRTLEADVAISSGEAATLDSFSLFSFVDKATSASVSRDAIASMNPAKRPLKRGLEENSVELRLTAVTLPEVVELLEKIEAATQPVYIKRVELKRRYDDSSRFDAIIVAGATSKT
ncbi:MAG: type II secretion system protein GspM [Candidatus Binatia bacterium]